MVPQPQRSAQHATRQTGRCGVILALLIISAWFLVHVTGVFVLPPQGSWLVLAPLLVLLQCWLYVGLFIVAHDSMHGSLAPDNPWLNRWLGSLCLWLYGAFSWQSLRRSHLAHHRFVGTARDPDFNAGNPNAFLPWYAVFMWRYSSWRQPALFGGMTLVYTGLVGVSLLQVLLFVVIPALLSSALYAGL